MTRIDRSQKDYDQSDVKQVLRRANPRDFDEMIQWLKREGDNYRRLTGSEVARMVDDASRAKQRKKQFVTDPARLYQEMKRS